MPILPEHIWKHVSPKAAITSYGDKPRSSAAAPSRRSASSKGGYIEMVRNPYYWGKKPTIDKIYFEMYQNPDTMVTDLRAGRIDGAWGIPVAEFKQLESVKGIKAIAHPFYDWDYLEFNCYDKAGSLGNPVLRDWRFRNALNYAIDKQRLASSPTRVLLSRRRPSSIRTRGSIPTTTGSHRPSQAYTFDLAKANQLLTAAGYPLKNGVRLNKQGKPIVLRLMTSTDQAGCQIDVKLIAGWLQQLGLTTKLSVVDYGTFLGDIYNAHGSTWAPNFDLTVSWWTGYYDAGVILNCLTTAEIGSLDEPYWSNPQYDRLAVAQASALDPQKRQASSGRCSRSCTSSRPGSRSPTPTSSKPSTPPSGPAGRRSGAPATLGSVRATSLPTSISGLESSLPQQPAAVQAPL